MAALLNEEETINASLSNEETINAQITPINYIPGYKEAEEERRANEEIRISNENTRKSNENERINYYNSLKVRVDNGEFDGATFIPNVNTDGDISWTNDKGLDNPTTRNIKGPKGDVGPQGQQGIQGIQGEQGIQGIQGIQGPSGKDFSISKTYSSIAEMYADKANVEIGDFVIISSSVEDPDNAKLYVRNNTQEGFGFITDMSGATGMKGDKGEQGIQGPQGATGPQGPQGEPGATYDDTALKTRVTNLENNSLNTSNNTQQKTGQLHLSTTTGGGLVTGSETAPQYTGVQSIRKCAADGDNVNTTGFIINSDGKGKILHRRGGASTNEDAQITFDATEFKFQASGTKGNTTLTDILSVSASSNSIQYKGKELARAEDVPTKTVLYDNPTGSNASITLSDDISNYSSLEIIFKDNDNYIFNSGKVIPNSNGYVNLYCINSGTNNLYFKSRSIVCSGTNISTNGNYYGESNATSNTFYHNNNIFIIKVIGHK